MGIVPWFVTTSLVDVRPVEPCALTRLHSNSFALSDALASRQRRPCAPSRSHTSPSQQSPRLALLRASSPQGTPRPAHCSAAGPSSSGGHEFTRRLAGSDSLGSSKLHTQSPLSSTRQSS